MVSYSELDKLKQQLDSYRPLSASIVKNLHEDLVVRWTYNSNAIEGNTLSLIETKVVLEGITIGGKPIKELFEAINHKEAIYYVEDLVRNREALSEWNIKSIHRLILKNIDNTNAGVYRKINVLISGAEHIPPDALHVQSDMEEFISWYKNEGVKLHPVERAARVHSYFVRIHPFVDGNGRTARLLMNLELMKDGFPPVVLPVEKRLEYYTALDMAHTKDDHKQFLSLIKTIVKQGFEPYWHVLGVSNIFK